MDIKRDCVVVFIGRTCSQSLFSTSLLAAHLGQTGDDLETTAGYVCHSTVCEKGNDEGEQTAALNTDISRLLSLSLSTRDALSLNPLDVL